MGGDNVVGMMVSGGQLLAGLKADEAVGETNWSNETSSNCGVLGPVVTGPCGGCRVDMRQKASGKRITL